MATRYLVTVRRSDGSLISFGHAFLDNALERFKLLQGEEPLGRATLRYLGPNGENADVELSTVRRAGPEEKSRQLLAVGNSSNRQGG